MSSGSSATARLAAWPRQHKGLVIILLIGLLFRVVAVGYLNGHMLVSDEPEYFGSALTLAQGRGFSYFDTSPWLRPPLYLLFLAGPMLVWGANTVPIVLLQVIVSEATVLLFYYLGRRLFGERVGLFSAAACAVYMPLSIFAGLMLAETLFLALLAAGILCLIKVLDSPRPLYWAGAAGVLLSLTGLTRGLLLAYVPVAAIWLLFVIRGSKKKLVTVAVFAGVFVAVMAPWTFRNYVAYGALIPGETTGAVNLWLGAEQGAAGRIYSELEALPSIPERQSVALSRALQVIQDDPMKWISSRVEEVWTVARINFSADERFTSGFTHGLVPGAYLIAQFLLDDTLYALLTVLAIAGVFLARKGRCHWLVVLWVLLSCVLAVVFFAINRFRFPVIPFLFPFAGYAVMEALPRLRYTPQTALRIFPAVVVCIGFLIAISTSYPYEFTRIGVIQWMKQTNLAEGDKLVEAGDLDGAVLAYRKADRQLPETRAAIARVKVMQDDFEAAENMVKNDTKYYSSKVILGDVYRWRGNDQKAKEFFADNLVKKANPTDWSFTALSPKPTTFVDVGGGLDLGYVSGMEADEPDGSRDFRWAQGNAKVRFPKIANSNTDILALHVNGWRPEGVDHTTVSVWANGVSVGSFVPAPEWDTYRFRLPMGILKPDGDLVIELKSDIFTPSFTDKRFLGVMVDWVSVGPAE